MSATITYSKTLVVVDCYACAITFAVPKDFDRYNREAGEGRTWYCPNGHGQVYSRSEITDLRKQLQRAQEHLRNTQAARDAARDQAEAAQRSANAYKGRVTRLKNRAAAGVCPCCNRSFENLRRHMTCKHPDFATAEEVAS